MEVDSGLMRVFDVDRSHKVTSRKAYHVLGIVQSCQGTNYPGPPLDVSRCNLCNWTVPSWRLPSTQALVTRLPPGERHASDDMEEPNHNRLIDTWHGSPKFLCCERFSFVKWSSGRSLSGFRSISPWGNKHPHRRIESSKRNARAKHRQENKLSKSAPKLGQHGPPKRDGQDTAAKLSFLAQTCIRPLHLPGLSNDSNVFVYLWVSL